MKKSMEGQYNDPTARSRSHSMTSDPGHLTDFVGINEEAANRLNALDKKGRSVDKKGMQLIRNAMTRRGNHEIAMVNPVSRNEMVKKRLAAAKVLQASRKGRNNNTAKAARSKSETNVKSMNAFLKTLNTRGATSKATAKNALAFYKLKPRVKHAHKTKVER